MFAALPPIAGSTPMITPMIDDQTRRNGRDRISQITFRCETAEARGVVDRIREPRRAAHLLDVGHDLRESEHPDQHRQERNPALAATGCRT